jgi:hypothetical protein
MSRSSEKHTCCHVPRAVEVLSALMTAGVMKYHSNPGSQVTPAESRGHVNSSLMLRELCPERDIPVDESVTFMFTAPYWFHLASAVP